MTRARLGTALVLAVSLLAAGCDRGDPPRSPGPRLRDAETIRHDLIERLPSARAAVETREIDVGTAAARLRLVEGFAPDEIRPEDGSTYAWSLGKRSRLRFDVARPRDLTLAFRCWPFDSPGVPAQVIRIELNGSPVGETPVGSGIGEYRTPLPSDRLVVGENELALVYAYTRRPADVLPGNADRRALAVAWDWIRIAEACGGDPPRADGDALVIPSCSGIDYHLDLAPGDVLAVDELRADGGAAPRLRIDVERAGSGEPLRFELEPSPGPRVLPLPVPGPGPARLSLWALPDPDAPGSTTTLTRPVVRSDRTARSPGPAPARDPDPRLEAIRADPARRPHVIIHLIDTLRFDHVGALGYDGNTTPRIDAFTAEGSLFPRAYAQSSWTRATVASILTGLHPSSHATTGRLDALPEDARTLAEILRDVGYQAGGFVANPNVTASTGFGQGFEPFEYLRHPEGGDRFVGSDVLVRRGLDWIDARDPARPFFLYLHAMDPHDPYDPPPALRDRFAPGVEDPETGSAEMMKALDLGTRTASEELRRDLLALYDGSIASADAGFGDLLDGLEGRGLHDDTVIVLVSDHGEEFLDHGWWKHGKTLFEDQIRILLAFRLPRVAGGGRPGTVAQQIDVVPTLLDHLGIPRPGGLAGRSLLGAIADPSGPHPSPPVFAELALDGREVQAVIDRSRKLIRYGAYDRPRPAATLFDLDANPAETEDRIGEAAVEAGYLEALRRDHVRLRAAPLPRSEARLEDDLEDQLRALGYLD